MRPFAAADLCRPNRNILPTISNIILLNMRKTHMIQDATRTIVIPLAPEVYFKLSPFGSIVAHVFENW